jgi:hypothetical protein
MKTSPTKTDPTCRPRAAPLYSTNPPRTERTTQKDNRYLIGINVEQIRHEYIIIYKSDQFETDH